MIDALAQATNKDPTALPPLYDAVDPDALDQLFEHRDDGSGGGPTLGFVVEDWPVFVRGDGRILVCDASRTVPPTPVFSTGDS